jgi:ABC-type sugar transport system permease subunit
LLDSRAGYSAAIAVALVALAVLATTAFMWLQQRRSSQS